MWQLFYCFVCLWINNGHTLLIKTCVSISSLEGEKKERFAMFKSSLAFDKLEVEIQKWMRCVILVPFLIKKVKHRIHLHESTYFYFEYKNIFFLDFHKEDWILKNVNSIFEFFKFYFWKFESQSQSRVIINRIWRTYVMQKKKNELRRSTKSAFLRDFITKRDYTYHSEFPKELTRSAKMKSNTVSNSLLSDCRPAYRVAPPRVSQWSCALMILHIC